MSIVPQNHPKKTTFYLRCNTYASNPHLRLCTHHCNNLEKVTQSIIKQIRKKCEKILEEENCKSIDSKGKICKSSLNIKNEIASLEKKIKNINMKIDQLFEDKYNELFEKEDFRRLYSKQLELRKCTEKRIEQLRELEDKENHLQDIYKLLYDFANSKEITRTMLVSLIEKIEISEEKEFTIYYKFNILNK